MSFLKKSISFKQKTSKSLLKKSTALHLNKKRTLLTKLLYEYDNYTKYKK